MPEPTTLTAGEVRDRAATGAALLGARGVLIYAVGIAVNLLLARLLAPRDFGLVALGTVVVVVGSYLAAIGLSAAIVQRAEDPTRRELEAVLGVQLAVTVTLALAAAAVAVPLGEDALVVATMTASLPIAMLRVPSVVVLERELEYRRIATADILEALVYYVWAVGTVAAGLGVWGLATAVVARAAAGSGYLLLRGPLGLVVPRWSWPDVRPLLRFGARAQLNVVLQIAREQGVNVVVAAVAGLATLGVWNLAWRVLQVPSLLFSTLGRIMFPAISRLLAAGENVGPVLERGIATLAALTGIVVVAMIGLAPALPAVVGDEWSDVPPALLWAGVALTLAAPLGVGGQGYLYAAGRPGTMAAATFVSGVVWCGVTALLLPEIGAPAVGVGWIGGALVSAALMWRVATTRTGARLAGRVGPPTAVALAAAAAAWYVAHLPGDAIVGGLAGAAAGEVVMLAGLAVFAPAALRDTRRLSAQGVASLRPA